jgi:hypothetical protein
MEACILKFAANHNAEDALQEATETLGDGDPWLHDIATVSRPLVGRVRIGASFSDGANVFREGDLARRAGALGVYTGLYVSMLLGPLSALFVPTEGGVSGAQLGALAEENLLHFAEIKKLLRPDSSLMVLLGSTETCDAMVRTFQSYYDHKVIRRAVPDDLRQTLEALRRMTAQLTGESADETAGSSRGMH